VVEGPPQVALFHPLPLALWSTVLFSLGEGTFGTAKSLRNLAPVPPTRPTEVVEIPTLNKLDEH